MMDSEQTKLMQMNFDKAVKGMIFLVSAIEENLPCIVVSSISSDIVQSEHIVTQTDDGIIDIKDEQRKSLKDTTVCKVEIKDVIKNCNLNDKFIQKLVSYEGCGVLLDEFSDDVYIYTSDPGIDGYINVYKLDLDSKDISIDADEDMMDILKSCRSFLINEKKEFIKFIADNENSIQ